jgi:alpha-D-xyloside xylohydrolase
VRDGIVVQLANGELKLQVCDERILRVVFSPTDTTSPHPSLVVNKQWQPPHWKIKKARSGVGVATSKVQATLDLQTGAVTFSDAKGNVILQEKPQNPHEMIPAVVADEETYHATQRFVLSADEALYGLGQQQDGVMNHRNHHLTLIQNNKHIAIPFVVSTRNYGLLWDNYSHIEFDDGPDGMSFWSEVADAIDYYFIRGSSLDDVIAGYREATGRVPLFPRWAFGYWQSKERYRSRDELLSVVREYRDRKIPIDAVVQDWQYWGNLGWNAMKFDEAVFPNPKEMIDTLHRQYHVQLMVSVWPQVGPGTAAYDELKSKGLLYPTEIWNGGKTYDAYSREAREIYWKHLYSGLFALGVDAWWMDATEPEWKWCEKLLDAKEGIVKNGQTALGSATRYLNTYPLVTTGGVYEHQRQAGPGRRVFILTRSAFAGQQRNATAVWSGDVAADWKVFRNQISGGLNASLSSIPYWTTDIGAFFPGTAGGEYPDGVKDPAYRELYVRWFQFGAFSPIFRSHGTGTPREVWRFGEPGTWAYDALVKFDNLRYRLLPYIYSVAWKVTHEHYTMMRGLPMDFPADPKVLALNNEYLFGPAVLVVPVTTEMYHRKSQPDVEVTTTATAEVYLPKPAAWYDFWTGEQVSGGLTINKPTPIDVMPLHVRAGSILPLGPLVQYHNEKPPDPIELRIYRGAGGEFTLYEDEGNNYSYEKGIYATISFRWKEQSQTLEIGKRKGSFPGMLKERSFHLVWVGKDRGVGVEPTPSPDRVVRYTGKPIHITLPGTRDVRSARK